MISVDDLLADVYGGGDVAVKAAKTLAARGIGWVPTVEQLPDVGRPVLAAWDSGHVTIGQRGGGGWHYDGGCWTPSDPHHWAPVPELPEDVD